MEKPANTVFNLGELGFFFSTIIPTSRFILLQSAVKNIVNTVKSSRLSCAVHAVNGHMAMRITVMNHLDEVTQVIQNFNG